MNTSLKFFVVGCLLMAPIQAVGQLVLTDVQIQQQDGQVVVGAAPVDELTGEPLSIDLTTRVFSASLQSNFASANPGFNSTHSENPLLPAGAGGFAPGTDLSFDFVPLFLGEDIAPLFYWDGVGSEVNFATPPSGTVVTQFSTTVQHVAQPGDQPTPGGVIDTTVRAPAGSVSDPDLFGTLHRHRTLTINDGDGNFLTDPEEGVYISARQIRVEGFETSEPILFVHRSFNTPSSALDLAVQFANDNYELLIGLLPGDFNEDGIVGPADYAVWRDNADGTFTPDDYQTWLDNFGLQRPTASQAFVTAAAVPEPAACLLIGIAGIGIAAGRRGAPIR